MFFECTRINFTFLGHDSLLLVWFLHNSLLIDSSLVVMLAAVNSLMHDKSWLYDDEVTFSGIKQVHANRSLEMDLYKQ